MDRLSVELHYYFFREERPTQVTLADVLKVGKERIFGLIFAFFGSILALPLPIPGLGILVGFIILVVSVQLAVGAKSPWIPKGLINKPLALKTVQGVMKQGILWLRRIEMFSRPRLLYILSSFIGRGVAGIALALVAIFLMIGLPGLHTLAGVGVLMTGLGLLVDDGVICLTGVAVCICADLIGVSSVLSLLMGGSSVFGCPST